MLVNMDWIDMIVGEYRWIDVIVSEYGLDRHGCW